MQWRELAKPEALLAARLLQGAEIELLPMQSLCETATRIAIEIDQPAYDCLHLAQALEKQCPFVTADDRFLQNLPLAGITSFATAPYR